MEIRPYIGFEQIKLGDSKESIISELGEEFKEKTESFPDGSSTTTLFYDEIGCAFDFSSEDDNQLGTITFYSPEFTLFGLPLIGLNENEFVAVIPPELKDIKLEDHFVDTDSKDFVSEKHGLSIWIQDEVVDSITIYPQFEDDDETVIWPS